MAEHHTGKRLQQGDLLAQEIVISAYMPSETCGGPPSKIARLTATGSRLHRFHHGRVGAHRDEAQHGVATGQR